MNTPADVVVFCESLADFKTASTLVDRVLEERTGASADSIRRWFELDGRPFVVISKIRDLMEKRRIRGLYGFLKGEPARLEAALLRRALVLTRNLAGEAAATVFVRDVDRRHGRLEGYAQARDAFPMARIVIGVPDLEREAWVLAGFDPNPDIEAEERALLKLGLGFDPRMQSERLDQRHDHDVRSPKRVLNTLIGDDWHRQERCWRETLLDVLRARGGGNGLRAFLQEVRRLLPTAG